MSLLQLARTLNNNPQLAAVLNYDAIVDYIGLIRCLLYYLPSDKFSLYSLPCQQRTPHGYEGLPSGNGIFGKLPQHESR